MVVAPPVPSPVRPRPARVGPRGWWALAGATYLVAALALHRSVVLDLGGRATGWVSSDSSLFVWWLEWTRHAVAHGANPLYSTFQNAPGGVNAAWNTTVPVLGVLLAPLTALAGPVAAYNVGVVLGPVVSGLLVFGVLRTWVERPWIRLLAGALYAFSPFTVAHASVGHLNLVWAVLPPVILWAVHRILVEPRRPLVHGALLGAAFALQMGLYTQTVALGAVALVLAGIVLAAVRPSEIRSRLPGVAGAAAACTVTFGVLCAYPLWLLLDGPNRPLATIRDIDSTGADLANLLVPTELTAVRAGTGGLAEQLRGYTGEQGSYIGPALLLAMILGAVLIRSTVLRLTVTITALLAVLSLGTSLVVLGYDTGLPLPWRLLTGVPLLGEAEPGRLAPFVALGVALAVALVLAEGAPRHRAVVPLVLLAALTWAPSDAQRSTSAEAPPFFTHAADHLAPGSTVDVLPRPSGKWVGGADPLLWQAVSGMAYRQTGGYFIGSGPGAPLLLESPASLLERGLVDRRTDPAVARDELVRRGVSAVLVVPSGVPDAPYALAWSAQVTGGPGRLVEGIHVFPVARP